MALYREYRFNANGETYTIHMTDDGFINRLLQFNIPKDIEAVIDFYQSSDGLKDIKASEFLSELGFKVTTNTLTIFEQPSDYYDDWDIDDTWLDKDPHWSVINYDYE